MGYFKEQDIERLQIEISKEEAENAQLRQMQPPLSSDFICSPGLDSLLDFAHVSNSRSVNSFTQQPAFSIIN